MPAYWCRWLHPVTHVTQSMTINAPDEKVARVTAKLHCVNPKYIELLPAPTENQLNPISADQVDHYCHMPWMCRGQSKCQSEPRQSAWELDVLTSMNLKE